MASIIAVHPLFYHQVIMCTVIRGGEVYAGHVDITTYFCWYICVSLVCQKKLNHFQVILVGCPHQGSPTMLHMHKGKSNNNLNSAAAN